MRRWLENLEDGLFQKSRGMGPPWGALLRWLRYPIALIRDWLGGEINIRAMSLARASAAQLDRSDVKLGRMRGRSSGGGLSVGSWSNAGAVAGIGPIEE